MKRFARWPEVEVVAGVEWSQHVASGRQAPGTKKR